MKPIPPNAGAPAVSPTIAARVVAALRVRGLYPGPRLVLACLAALADEHGHCRPATGELEVMTGLDAATVGSHLEVLEMVEVIGREADGYAITLPPERATVRLPDEFRGNLARIARRH